MLPQISQLVEMEKKVTTTFTCLPFLPVIFPSRKFFIFCDKNSLFALLQRWLGEGKKLGPLWIFYWRCLSLIRMVSPLRTSRFCLKEILMTWRCLRFFSRHSKQPRVEYTEVLQTKQTKQTKELMSPAQKHIPACNYVRWVTFFAVSSGVYHHVACSNHLWLVMTTRFCNFSAQPIARSILAAQSSPLKYYGKFWLPLSKCSGPVRNWWLSAWKWTLYPRGTPERISNGQMWLQQFGDP